MIRNLYIIFFLILISACSTSKNTSTTRAFHNMNAHFNVYFNANESLKSGIKKLKKNEEDYSKILPVFKYEDLDAANLISSDMDLAIKKCAKTIKSHSITVKPKSKSKDISTKDKEFLSKTEYCKWIDDAYLVMGKAHFFKREFETAKQTFLQNINKYSKENTTDDAKLWLAKTYAETKDYKNAELLLGELQKSKRWDKDFLHEINLTYASIYLKQKEYDQAAQKLNAVIADKTRKKENPRLNFILGQIYQRNNQNSLAIQNYKKVIRQNPNYDMTFKSKINLAEIYEKSGGDADELKKQFIKMLKDEKNVDYYDQLFYALGKIEQNQNNIGQAIEYFQLSSSSKSSNRTQKSKTYLALADLYFSRDRFGLAESYFDSTISVMENTFPDYENIFPLIQNKKALSKNLNVIQREDSLQILAKLPVNERNAIIDAQIEKVRANEQIAALEKQKNTIDPYLVDNDLDNQRTMNTGDGAVFYFYNPSVVSFGQTEFKKRWGDRKLEDNWRRSNKQSGPEIEANNEITGQKNDSVKNNEKVVLNNKSRDFYLQNVPLTPEKLKSSNLQIEQALLNSGVLYDKNFNETDKAINQFERLLIRFPESENRLDVFQKLHKLYEKKPDYAMAEKTKQSIIKDFPESLYAKMLADPSYFQKLKKEQDEIEKTYETAYKRYQNKEFVETIGYCEHGLKNFPESSLAPNFLFLKAMAYANKGDKQLFKETLELLVSKYPNEEVSERSRSMLEIISGRKYEEQLFLPSNDSVHYYALVYPKNKVDLNKLKFKFISLNAQKYTQDNFSILVVALDNSRDILLVQSFKNSQTAMQYFQNVIAEGILKDFSTIFPSNFIISANNYNTLLKNKEEVKYQKFFEEQYLKN